MTLYFTNVERHISHDLNPGKQNVLCISQLMLLGFFFQTQPFMLSQYLYFHTLFHLVVLDISGMP